MTFSEEQQRHVRKLFIEKCRQKAWGAYTPTSSARSIDELMADHEKLKKEEADLEAQTNAIDTTPDCSRKTSQSNARHYRSAATAGQAEML